MYKKHEYNIYPELTGEQYDNLKKSIQAGYDDSFPIIIFENKILDGWNRYLICKELNIEPVFKEFEGNELDAVMYVIKSNVRRDLEPSVRAALIVDMEELVSKLEEEARKRKLANLKHDESMPPRGGIGRTSQYLANLAQVGQRTIERVKSIKKKDPKKFEDIKRGKITAKEAEKELKQQQRHKYIQEQQEKINKGELKLLEGKFEVIVIDPPWAYGTKYDPEYYIGRAACPYPEMTQEELKQLEIPAADDCIMFLWTTHRFIWDAKELLDYWGFDYKCMLVWDKQKMGVGRFLRLQCEFCLIGIKGNPILNNDGTFRDILYEARREHSRKPEAFYEMVNKLCVGRKLDYFARELRDGWEVYGNETDKFVAR